MGDCPDDDKTRNSLNVFSSNFKDYCHGKPVLLYMYEILMHYGLLESSAGDMPDGTEHSSASSSNRATAATRPMPGRAERKGSALTRELVSALSAPLVIAESPAQAKLNFFAAQAMELQAARQRLKLGR